MSDGPALLGEHRKLNADSALVKEIEERVRESGVEYVHYQTVTISGRVVGKTVPARHLRRGLEEGVRMIRLVLADMRTDRSGNPIGGGVNATEFVAMPDPDTFAVLPWDPGSARFLCRLYEPEQGPEETAGRPLPADARGGLMRLHGAFTQRTGLEMRTGCEPESTWTGPGAEAAEGHRVSPAFHADSLDRLRPVYRRIVAYGQAMGLDMVEGGHEGDDGQLEMNWAHDRAERTADRLIDYRRICRQVARELGMDVTLMPKPPGTGLGNGCHHNVSLWRGEENAFTDPAADRLHLTGTGRHALGGLLRHAAAMAAVLCPTVNSYKRLLHGSDFTPSRIDWGRETKSCAVRLPANGRLEFRLPDALANPYLSHAVLLSAMEDGIRSRIDPGPPKGEGGNAVPFPALPGDLGRALELFAADPVVTAALGTGLADLFLEMKTAEWSRFRAAVTDWESAEYRDAVC
ncbi:glutamine synthetase family protein [Nocardiopsis sp. CNT-189]|uniref:glutamine synthetase family protein n=1 Tax=Nocardiopsis oceanisediminis TaxID=2816862 RepID=UPI003B3AB670